MHAMHAATAFLSLVALLLCSSSHGFVFAPSAALKPFTAASLQRCKHSAIGGLRFKQLRPFAAVAAARRREYDQLDQIEDEEDATEEEDEEAEAEAEGYETELLDDGDQYEASEAAEKKEKKEKKRREAPFYEEIDHIVEGLKIYKELYDTMSVGKKFKVPESPQWPRHLWNMRLGTRLHQIALDPEVPPEAKAKLEAVGFKIKGALLDSWEVFLAALTAYKRMYGDVDVKTTFRVPKSPEWPAETHGYPLGGRVAMVRSVGRFVLGHPHRKQVLDEMGFSWEGVGETKRTLGREWAQIRQGLFELRFSKPTDIQPDMILPMESVRDPALFGMKIGEIYHTIQNNADAFYESTFAQKVLKELGIEFNVARRNAIDALRCYRERYQHVDVPHMFVVPPAEPWPRNTHRMPLGSFVRVIRKGMFADDPDFRRELDLLGFRWDHPEHQPKLVETEAEKTQRLRARIEKALPGFYEFEANRISYADHMNMRVLAEDRVDLTLLSELDRERYLFLREVRALKRPGWNPVATLQQKEDTLAYDEVAQKQIRAHLEEHEVQQQMDAIVYWIMRQYNLTETLEDYANKLPGPSLNATMGLEPLVLGGEHTAFARKYNPYKDTKNLRIPFDMAAGYKLNAMYEAMINSPMVHERGTAWFGLNVTAIDLSKLLHRRGTPEQQESIRRHGYRLVEFDGWNFNDVLTALTTYKTHYGSLDVPADYKLKEPALKPGSRIYNMPLGVFVKRLQDGDVDGIDDPYRKQKLEAIGFKWKNPKEMLRFRWYPFIIGLMMHLQIEEDVDVEPDYVIPDNDLFPVWIRGLQLGKMVQMCRQQQNLLFKKFPDRAALLDDYDFKWWIPPVETTGFDEMLPDGTGFYSMMSKPLPPEEHARISANREKLERMPIDMWMEWFSQMQNSSVVFPEPPEPEPKKPGWPLHRRRRRRGRHKRSREPKGILPAHEELQEMAEKMHRRAAKEDPRDLDEIDPGELTFS